MHISVFGMGYVGTVCATCWAQQGHSIIGVDINGDKVSLINQGTSPIVEPGLNEALPDLVKSDRIRATSEALDAVLNSSLSMICVGTPSQMNGNLDLRFVRSACEQIGVALKHKTDFHDIVVRSTMLPGTTRQILIPIIEQASGKRFGNDFGVAVNPEFLREGSALEDFYSPPKTVVGVADRQQCKAIGALYESLGLDVIYLDMESAEMIKYADNCWHATKVVFANEIGNLCRSMDIDGQRVMEVFCQDRKLNLSASYLRPGFAFGGSCLPKDVRALSYRAKTLDLTTPLLDSLLASNQYQIERALQMVQAQPSLNVGLLGLSFKAGTDDLRESPLVELAERLLGKGYNIRIYDPNISLARIGGANKDFLLNKLPHISRLLEPDIENVTGYCDVLVVGNRSSEFKSLIEKRREGQVLVDLVRIAERRSDAGYQGICW